MLTPNYSSKFKRDLQLMQKRSYAMRKIFKVMIDLQEGVSLAPSCREHRLIGEYRGFTECHIDPDWLLVYRIDKENQVIYFVRTGTHSDLF
jgi:mRNA interferase YafQ